MGYLLIKIITDRNIQLTEAGQMHERLHRHVSRADIAV